MASYSVIAFGCKVNQVEAQGLREQLEHAGFSPAAGDESPDIIVLHTCAVTAEAMRKVRQRLRSVRRENPNTILAVSGCYVIAEAQALANEAEIDLIEPDISQLIDRVRAEAVPGSAGKEKQVSAGRTNRRCNLKYHPEGIHIPDQSTAQAPPRQPITIESDAPVKNQSTPALTHNMASVAGHRGHHRAFVKIQDGCDSFCSFCVVPRLRSEIRSKPVAQTVAEVAGLLTAGFREIVLVGIHLGAWGQSTTRRGLSPFSRAHAYDSQSSAPAKKGTVPIAATPVSRLPKLLGPLLELDAPNGKPTGEPSGEPWRIRLSSIEAREVTDELLELMAQPRVCPHLHMPLQSGADDVLARMNRPTSADAFRETVARARRTLDEPALTTDVIVGFPGETDDDFQQTVDLCRELAFMKIHVFPFSPRTGTAAAEMPGQVPVEVRRRRARVLRELSDEMAAEFIRQFIGRAERVLPERVDGQRQTASGHADRYFEIAVPTPAPLGALLQVDITAVDGSTAVGRRA